MATIKINGKEVEAPDGANLLEVCLDNGVYVPHFCWHPGLVPEGNCRMCLVKVSTSRKLEASCMTRVSDKMEVETECPEVHAARKDVLEFLLANHPLDCPICDKAGECDLQDLAFDHRGGLSRMKEKKVAKPRKDLGPDIRIWQQRCVLCTRCVRFTCDVTGTGELAVMNRGDHCTIDVFPGIPIDNPLSLNVTDLCPVGALIDKNFMYTTRVWYASEVDSVCPSCSRGCNVKVTAQHNRVRRLSPRRNLDVNGYWMCDYGRKNFLHVSADRRLSQRRGAPDEIAGALKTYAGAVGVLVSTWQTVEELYLLRKLVEALKVDKVGFLTRTEGERQEFPGGFVIEADKTPNRTFAEMLFGAEVVASGARKVIEDLKAGNLKALLVINGVPDYVYPQEITDALSALEWVGVVDLLQSELSDRANLLLPGAAFAEKDGVFLNVDGRAQRIRAAFPPPAGARPEAEILQEALAAAGARKAVLSAAEVFAEAAAEIAALRGLDHEKIGRKGMPADRVNA